MINIHGTALALDGFGLLLRGRTGAGKSLLALQLLDTWQMRGRKASLVADDRIDIENENGKIVMSPPAALAGLIELRGRGIVTRPYRTGVALDLVVDMTGELIRFLENEELQTEIEGVRLHRCPVPERGIVDSAHQILLVSEAISRLAGPEEKTNTSRCEKTTKNDLKPEAGQPRLRANLKKPPGEKA
jgi:HPr kinase/phosphorylase